jgi:hypothetical protein
MSEPTTSAAYRAPHELMEEDLKLSGLTPYDVKARVVEGPERAATKTPHSTNAYVLPYYDMFGKALPHYRVRLFDSEIKYRQPKDSPSHIYFPRDFMAVAKKNPGIVIITEGEKKAALACKLGYPCVGLGGVDAWKNRIIQMVGDPVLSQKGDEGNKVTKAKLDSGAEVNEDYMSSLATGFQDLSDFLLSTDAMCVIIFDSDKATGVKPQVQRAAATLGYELRSKGIPFANIRQLILPWDRDDISAAEDKMGLDDYLMSDGGVESFQYLLRNTVQKRSAFPRHPSVVDYIGKRLQKSKLSRREATHIAMAVLCEIDSLGMRLRSPEEKQMYYFDFQTKTLMQAGFLKGQNDDAHDTPFGGLLYRRFGLSAADQKALVWLSAQFNGEHPIEEVSPERVFAKAKPGHDRVCLQINNGQYVRVDKDGISIKDNGVDKILFEADHVVATDAVELAREYRKRQREPLTNWWDAVLEDVRLADHDKAQKLHSLLYYISPWLYRWRGTQLPIELVLGESGSGKSTLAELRLSILSGIVKLRNSPQDIKDWHASIVNSGGLHVTDNVQFTDKQLRQRLSDELCRLVTEPHPAVEQRKYFTNSDVVRYPVSSVFSLTAILQPFQNADVLQRSVLLNLDKPSDPSKGQVMYDMNWSLHKMTEKGGRTAWLAHHLHVLELFFKEVDKSWDPAYRAKHRLINLEQSLIIMGKVFGMDCRWIPDYLVGITNTNITDADWTFEGITAFCKMQRETENIKNFRFTAKTISEWAEFDDDFKECELLINTRKLGRYIISHKSMLAQVVGMVEDGKTLNRMRYKLIQKAGSSADIIAALPVLTPEGEKVTDIPDQSAT